MEERIRGIYEASGLDPEKMVAPRELWPSNRSDDLKTWYESRDELRTQKDKQRALDNY